MVKDICRPILLMVTEYAYYLAYGNRICLLLIYVMYYM